MPVHVGFMEIQQDRDVRAKVDHRLELEAGDFEYIEIGGLLLKKIQCRDTDIAAHTHLTARRLCHFTNKCCDGALAIGAGNGDNRCIDFMRKQVNITGNLHAALTRLLQDRIAQRDAWADNDALRIDE